MQIKLINLFQKKSRLNSSNYTASILGLGGTSILSGNAYNFLAFAQWMQFLSLFQLIPFKAYP